jgi:hypothetical protein
MQVDCPVAVHLTFPASNNLVSAFTILRPPHTPPSPQLVEK